MLFAQLGIVEDMSTSYRNIMEPKAWRSATELAQAVRWGDLRATDVTERSIARALEVERRFGCFATLDEAGARAAAATVDERVKSDLDAGSLAGVPVGVKENIAVAGLPASAGAPRPRPAATEDADVVRRLRAAGAVVMGTQRMHELGLGLDTPPTRNAWDTTRYPGGSTAGGAVSVALGVCAAAIGTDSGGSVRKPAALNGLVGLKPTFDRVCRRGVLPPSTSLDHVGIVARTVADVAAVLQVVDVDPDVGDLLAWLRESPRAARVGVPRRWFGAVRSDVRRVFDASLASLAETSIEVIDLDLALPAEDWEAWKVIGAAESYAQHADRLSTEPDSYSDVVREALMAGTDINTAELDKAYTQREDARSRIESVYAVENLDALATPTNPMPAIPLADFDPVRDLPSYSSLLFEFNMTGQPAISVPSGLSEEGLPLGLQLAGLSGQDALLLQIASMHERVHPQLMSPHALD